MENATKHLLLTQTISLDKFLLNELCVNQPIHKRLIILCGPPLCFFDRINDFIIIFSIQLFITYIGLGKTKPG